MWHYQTYVNTVTLLRERRVNSHLYGLSNLSWILSSSSVRAMCVCVMHARAYVCEWWVCVCACVCVCGEREGGRFFLYITASCLVWAEWQTEVFIIIIMKCHLPEPPSPTYGDQSQHGPRRRLGWRKLASGWRSVAVKAIDFSSLFLFTSTLLLTCKKEVDAGGGRGRGRGGGKRYSKRRNTSREPVWPSGNALGW